MRDGYVAAAKGVILSIAPEAVLVDISHGISGQDVMEGAYVLRQAAPFFPAGTIHLVVIDPDVGTQRHAIAFRHKGQTYVGPDNGLFSLLLSGANPEELVRLDLAQFWRSPDPSPTFHGRDIFAAVAAHLASGVSLSTIGSRTAEMRAMYWALPIADRQGLQGWIFHIDAFGNCISNITSSTFERWWNGRPFKCYVGNTIIEKKCTTYADVPAGEELLLFNSGDYLEVALHRGNASQMLDIHKGTSINIVFSDLADQKTT
jgi:S-adenosyl-L-methionine hydrolase (adenosine-forming)